MTLSWSRLHEMTVTETKRIFVVVGTRPEAIKMAPLIRALQRDPRCRVITCATAQHRAMLDEVLELFSIVPEIDLDLMRPDQTLIQLTSGVLAGIEQALDATDPDIVLVHGDTTTAMAAALAAFYQRRPIGHVEAGLRTGRLNEPWPEEMNRKFIDLVAHWYFTPTAHAAAALLAEGVEAARVWITGNTVTDALRLIRERINGAPALAMQLAGDYPWLEPDRRLVLVTGHRRENQNGGLARVCAALKRLADRPDVQVVWPVHPNPRVVEVVDESLAGYPHIACIPPQDYLHFVYLMDRAALILTDSGGIQEEAPSLGKPVLVLRGVTERPEAVEAGVARVIGTDTARIVAEAERLLDDPTAYGDMANRSNPFGDGFVSERIIAALMESRIDPIGVN